MNYEEKEKAVEELKEWIYFLRECLRKENEIKSIMTEGMLSYKYHELIEKAKLLKKEIEKGCNEFVEGNAKEFIESRIVGHQCAGDCPDCQSLINRLNKIIGDEE